METGKQYSKDNNFKAAARLHQSKYRAEVLKVDFDEYGNRLTESSGQALLNYYDKLNCRTTLLERYPSYSKIRDADMLRSEHIPFNLFAPMKLDLTSTREILSKAFEIDILKVLDIQFEYAPSPKGDFLDDGTAFDTFFLCETPLGRCGIGVEVKYTEQSYPIGHYEAIRVKDPHSTYWKTTTNSSHFQNNDDKELGEDELRQIWRNHLLGLSMLKRGHFDEFYSLTVYPSRNQHFVDAIPNYQTKLKDKFKHTVRGVTFEKFIDSIDGSVDILEWKQYLLERYIP